MNLSAKITKAKDQNFSKGTDMFVKRTVNKSNRMPVQGVDYKFFDDEILTSNPEKYATKINPIYVFSQLMQILGTKILKVHHMCKYTCEAKENINDWCYVLKLKCDHEFNKHLNLEKDIELIYEDKKTKTRQVVKHQAHLIFFGKVCYALSDHIRQLENRERKTSIEKMQKFMKVLESEDPFSL